MGMSASQCRLLSLTARLSDLELSAQSISNSKIRLSQRSEDIAREYSDALDKEKLTVMSGYNASTGAATYVDASAYNLTTYNAVSTMDKQRFLKDTAGRVLVTSKVGTAYDNALSKSQQLQQQYPTAEAYLNSQGYTSDSNNTNPNLTYDAAKVTYYTNVYTGLEAFLKSLGYTSDPNANNNNSGTGTSTVTDAKGGTVPIATYTYDQGAVAYYTNVFNEIKENGYNEPGDDNMQNGDWLYSQLSSGNVSLYENNGTGDFTNVSWSSGDSTLQSKSDDADIARAEAKYNVEMAEVQSKDKRFDLSLKSIDTEHTAIQTEMDSVKKVIDKNIEKSFKIFDA
ncbi:MAG: hypothetical protein WCY19_04500 [Candidatus Gastranaerophilaceae bacterium]